MANKLASAPPNKNASLEKLFKADGGMHLGIYPDG